MKFEKKVDSSENKKHQNDFSFSVWDRKVCKIILDPVFIKKGLVEKRGARTTVMDRADDADHVELVFDFYVRWATRVALTDSETISLISLHETLIHIENRIFDRYFRKSKLTRIG